MREILSDPTPRGSKIVPDVSLKKSAVYNGPTLKDTVILPGPTPKADPTPKGSEILLECSTSSTAFRKDSANITPPSEDKDATMKENKSTLYRGTTKMKKRKVIFKLPKSSDPIYRNPECFMNPEEIIANHGYQSESHHVKSDQGYIVSLLRISKTMEKSSGKDVQPAKRPIFLFVHGLGMNAISWVFNKDENVLVYQLASQGFEVWLLNVRGSEESARNHVTLSSKSKKYWSFSWHEMGAYDLPRVIDHILYISGQEQIFYVGHSMGCTQLFVAASINPEIAPRIKLMIALCPAVYVSHSRTFLLKCSRMIPSGIYKLFNHGEMYNERIYNTTRNCLPCLRMKKDKGLRTASSWGLRSLNLVNGRNIEQVYIPMLPVISCHLPSGTSVRTYEHFTQIYRSGEFRQYDYGRLNNHIYGQKDPPTYDLSKATFPVAIFGAKNDYCVGVEDIQRLEKELPNVKLCHIMEQPTWNHIDFIFGKDCGELVNELVFKLISEHL